MLVKRAPEVNALFIQLLDWFNSYLRSCLQSYEIKYPSPQKGGAMEWIYTQCLISLVKMASLVYVVAMDGQDWRQKPGNIRQATWKVIPNYVLSDVHNSAPKMGMASSI